MSNQLTPKKGSSHVTTTDKRGEKTSERSKTTTNVRRITLVINFLFPCFPLRLMFNRSTASENVDRVSAQPTSLRYSHRSSREELAPTWNGPTRRHHERPKHTQQTGYLIKSNKKKKKQKLERTHAPFMEKRAKFPQRPILCEFLTERAPFGTWGGT